MTDQTPASAQAAAARLARLSVAQHLKLLAAWMQDE